MEHALETGAEPKLRTPMEELVFVLRQFTILEWIVSGTITGFIMQFSPPFEDFDRWMLNLEPAVSAWLDQGWLVAAPARASPRFRWLVSYKW